VTGTSKIAGLTDFGPDRSKLFGNSADEYLKVHQRDRTQADVTEGSGGIWERLHYDWSDPQHVVRDGKNLKGRLLGLVLRTIGKSVLEKAFVKQRQGHRSPERRGESGTRRMRGR
jgi:hypothetical protein